MPASIRQIVSLVQKGLLSHEDAATELNMSLEKFKEMLETEA